MEHDLSIISIQAAEDLGRISKNLESGLDSAKNLSKIIKEGFKNNSGYQIVFADAYFAVYNQKVLPILKGRLSEHYEEISKKLEIPGNLNDKELSDLIEFCVILSDYSSAHEEELRNFRGPCFQ